MIPRRNFSKATKREAFERSNGVCECRLVPMLPTFGEGCGAKLSPGNTFYEHITPDGINGSPTLENCAVLVKTCWRLKTDSYDLPVIAKSNRVSDLARGIRNASEMRGSRNHPWQEKKKFNGQVVRR